MYIISFSKTFCDKKELIDFIKNRSSTEYYTLVKFIKLDLDPKYLTITPVEYCGWVNAKKIIDVQIFQCQFFSWDTITEGEIEIQYPFYRNQCFVNLETRETIKKLYNYRNEFIENLKY